MSNANQDERPAGDALGLMVGWLWIFGGVAVLVFERQWKGSLFLFAVGAAFIVPILWHERRQRLAQKPRTPSGLTGGWITIVLGFTSLGFGSLREWKGPAAIIAIGAAAIVADLWRERRKRYAQKSGATADRTR